MTYVPRRTRDMRPSGRPLSQMHDVCQCLPSFQFLLKRYYVTSLLGISELPASELSLDDDDDEDTDDDDDAATAASATAVASSSPSAAARATTAASGADCGATRRDFRFGPGRL